MRFFNQIAILVILVSSCAKSKVFTEDDIQIIPKPAELKINEGFFEFSKKTKFVTSNVSQKEISNTLIGKFNTAAGWTLEVVKQAPKKNYIQFSIDANLANEAYLLNVTKDNIIINANGNAGFIYGLESIRQLLPAAIESAEIVSNEEWIIPNISISDKPRFKWRGLMLDLSRHFFDKEYIKEVIDGLAMHKINILHLHLVDDQGWRIEIKKYPKLTDIGAWRVDQEEKHWSARKAVDPNQKGTYGGFLSQDDLKELVAYAQLKNVEIIPEIEMPAHVTSAIAAYPELSCLAKPVGVPSGGVWPITDIYCAGKEATFKFLENVLIEVMDIFPSKYIHIGGDEAPKYRWKHCKKCQQRMKEEGLHDAHELQSYFITRVENFLNENGRQLIGWDEILEGGLAPSATVQSWRGEEGGIAAAKSGHDAIMSPTSHCYFDYGLDATDLKEVYHYEPIPAELTAEEAKHILGGECNMWSERAPQDLVDSKVFPRILAMSEVLWSAKEKDYENFYARVQKHYPKLDALGVNYGYESVPITSTVVFNSDSFAISLFMGVPDMRLEYNLNNGAWQNYTTPFGVNATSTLKVRGFKNKKPYGELEQELIKHKASGKKVTYIIPYSRHYKGTGDNNLTDGLLGSTENFRDGYYQGFSGTDMEVIIDLGQNTTFSNIETTFFQYYLSWIVLPTSISYAISDDGENFNTIETVTNKIPLMKEGKFKHTFSFENETIKAKYLKVNAKTVGKLPQEHPAAGSDAWIFVDEVIIE